MTTQVLEYLIAIEEEHSLTRAAERFYLSQPSLSYHLARAEQELKVKLFQKKGRSLLPTEEGIIFFNAARAILHAEAQTRKLEWFQKTVLPSLNQNIQIQLTPCGEEEAFRSLEAGQTDALFLVHRGPLPAGPWKQQTLRQDVCHFALPHIWAQHPLPSDLLPLCFLSLQDAGIQNLWEQESLTAAGLHPKMVCTAPDLSTVVSMITGNTLPSALPYHPGRYTTPSASSLPATPNKQYLWIHY